MRRGGRLAALLVAVPAWMAGAGLGPAGSWIEAGSVAGNAGGEPSARPPPWLARPILSEPRLPGAHAATARPGTAELLRRLAAVAAQRSLLDRAPLASALDLRFVPARDGQRGAAGWLAAWDARVTWNAQRSDRTAQRSDGTAQRSDGTIRSSDPGAPARATLRVQLGPAANCIPPEAVAATFGRGWRPRYGPDAPPTLPRMEYRLQQHPAAFPGTPVAETVLGVAFRPGPCAAEFRFAEGSGPITGPAADPTTGPDPD